MVSNKDPLPDKSERIKADDLFDLSNTPTDSSPLLRHAHDHPPASRVVPTATPVDIHPLTPADTSSQKPPGDKLLGSESYQQLCATFTRAMAHTAYIPFCRLLGQVRIPYLNANVETPH